MFVFLTYVRKLTYRKLSSVLEGEGKVSVFPKSACLNYQHGDTWQTLAPPRAGSSGSTGSDLRSRLETGLMGLSCGRCALASVAVGLALLLISVPLL